MQCKSTRFCFSFFFLGFLFQRYRHPAILDPTAGTNISVGNGSSATPRLGHQRRVLPELTSKAATAGVLGLFPSLYLKSGKLPQSVLEADMVIFAFVGLGGGLRVLGGGLFSLMLMGWEG